MSRPDGRSVDELRPLNFHRDFVDTCSGSVLVSFGRTRVLCTASVSEGVPRWMRDTGKGWVTAEYSMLPGSSPDRIRRRTSGRSQEIQRLIGRSLRAIVDMKALGEREVIVDCDVLQADGGTRTASITGGSSPTAASKHTRWSANAPRSRSGLSTGYRYLTCPTSRTLRPRST